MRIRRFWGIILIFVLVFLCISLGKTWGNNKVEYLNQEDWSEANWSSKETSYFFDDEKYTEERFREIVDKTDDNWKNSSITVFPASVYAKGVDISAATGGSLGIGMNTTTEMTTDIWIDNRTFCPVCQEKGMKSRVYMGTSSTTLVYNPIWYDEDGNMQYQDTNTTTTNYSCSKGHEWIESYHMGESKITVTKDTEGGSIWAIEDTEEDELIVIDTTGTSLLVQDESLLFDLDWYYEAVNTVIFGDNVGKFSWGNGVLEFEGNLTESAEVFFDYLKPMIDSYIEDEKKKIKGVTYKESGNYIAELEKEIKELKAESLAISGIIPNNFF